MVNNIIRYSAILCIIISISLSAFSCKNAAKKLAKETTEEVIEGSAKNAGKKALSSTAKNSGKRWVRNMGWKEALDILKEENPLLTKAIGKLSKKSKKSIASAACIDEKFFQSLKSSNSLLEDYSKFTKDAPKTADNIDFLRLFAKNDLSSKSLLQKNCLERLVIKEEHGLARILDKTTGKTVAEYSDGILKFNNVERILPDNHMLRGDLLPNSMYKLTGNNNLEYLVSIDELGRIYRVEAKNVNPDEIVSNIIRRDNYLDLGPEWNQTYKQLKQASKGDDVTAVITYRYADDGATPQFASLDATINAKKKVSKSFSNISGAAKNEAAIKHYAKRYGMDWDKQLKLLNEMSSDEGLAKLIHSDPDFNISRWLKTRNHVDVNQIRLTPKGKFPPNSRTYAGNTYYFNPHLNYGLKARLERGSGKVNLRGFKDLTYDDLIRLDKLYPDGVPFTKEGFPDFSKVAMKGKDGKPLFIDIGELTGSQRDISKAETLFQEMGYKWEPNYTWHHVENTTTLLRVPTDIHQLIDHAGGVSMSGH